VANHRSLEDNRCTASVEQFDRERGFVALYAFAAQRNVNFPSLEIDNDEKDENRGHQTVEIRGIGSKKGMINRLFRTLSLSNY